MNLFIVYCIINYLNLSITFFYQIASMDTCKDKGKYPVVQCLNKLLNKVGYNLKDDRTKRSTSTNTCP